MDSLKRIEKIVREDDFDEKNKKAGLKFNPGLALVGLRTTGPTCSHFSVPYTYASSRLSESLKQATLPSDDSLGLDFSVIVLIGPINVSIALIV